MYTKGVAVTVGGREVKVGGGNVGVSVTGSGVNVSVGNGNVGVRVNGSGVNVGVGSANVGVTVGGSVIVGVNVATNGLVMVLLSLHRDATMSGTATSVSSAQANGRTIRSCRTGNHAEDRIRYRLSQYTRRGDLLRPVDPIPYAVQLMKFQIGCD